MRRDYPFKQSVQDLLGKDHRWQNVKDKEGVCLVFQDLHEIAGMSGFLHLDERFMGQNFGVKEKALMLERKASKDSDKAQRGPRNAYVLYPDFQYDHFRIVAVSDIVTPRSQDELEVLVELSNQAECRIAVHPKDRAKYFVREVRVLLPVNDYNHRPQIGELELVDKAHDQFINYQRKVDGRYDRSSTSTLS